MHQSLISIIEATTRAILVIDDHPMGGIIVAIILLSAGLFRGISKPS
jgi:hypothetical protein